MTIIPNITYKSVLQPIKNIEKRNKAFHELSDEGKRLEIAWDLLQLVVGKKIGANRCGYWNNKLLRKRNSSKDSKELQEKLLYTNAQCTVCQRGGIMLSTIRLGNKLGPDVSHISDGEKDILEGFDMVSMYMMEDEYEGGTYSHPYKIRTREKIANICCNILVNGDFNTLDTSNYLIIK